MYPYDDGPLLWKPGASLWDPFDDKDAVMAAFFRSLWGEQAEVMDATAGLHLQLFPVVPGKLVVAMARELDPRFNDLTDTEQEVCGLLRNYDCNDVARLRGTAPQTVRNQVRAIADKLGLAGIAEVRQWSIENAH